MSREVPAATLVADPAGSEDALRRWHDASRAHGGRRLEDVDAPTLTFPSVSAALACAKQLQRDGDPGAATALRIGIHVGDEHNGPTEAAALALRLHDRAEPAQVLVSHAAHALVAGQPGHEFRDLGLVPLAVDGAPVGVWELLWHEPEPRTKITLCGQLRVEIDGREVAANVSGGQAAALLRFLLATRNGATEREKLIAVLWPARPPKDPQADLRAVLSRLRRAVSPATVEGRERLRLALPEPVWVDVEEAVRAVETARAAARGSLWESAREQSAVALELLGPGFLPEDESEWAEARRRELDELALEALEWLARSSLALGGAELGAAERASRELIGRSPYRETGYRLLMEALAAAGNVAEALRVYDELRLLLRNELGTAPAPEVQELHKRLLAGGRPGRSAAVAEQAQPVRRVPLPSLLAPRERAALVGRERELEALRAAWQEARSGRRRLLLLAGDPGIGKTRLTSALAAEAHDQGTVLYASCQEEALVSYQPFVEALRHYIRGAGIDWLGLAPGAGAAELARLIPELTAALPGPDAVPPSDPETRRYLLFEAVSSFLSVAAARTPLVLVLDDLHWADRATLHLLRHVVRAADEAPLLIVGAYRHGEVGAEHPLAELLADLRRDRLFVQLSLEGLGEREVGALIAAHGGLEASPGLVGTVHEQTEGNPFFVEEVLRHLIETGVLFERGGRWASARTLDEIGVPHGVKEVITKRLARVSEGCRATLSQAAVLGREFPFDVLRAMAAADDEDAVIGDLEEAVDVQLVVEASGRASPAYAFTHALVRETLYDALGGPRKQRLHARAAAAIEQIDGEARLAALAVHHRLAGAAGDPRKAVEFSLRAGAEGREVAAWDEAAAHWDGALTVLERSGGHEAERAQLLVALADLMVVSGDLTRQIDYLERALALHEQLGDAERAAQVHSRLGMAHSLIDSIYADHLDIPRAFRHFDAAEEVLGRGPVRKARGHLETGISTALTYGLRLQEGIAAAGRAMEIAEELGDELLWTSAAEAHSWHTLVTGELSEGFTGVERAFEVADRHQRPFLAWMALNMRGQLTWGLGAPDEAQAFFERSQQLSYIGKTAYRQENADGVGRCHASRGELEEARALLSDARPAWITHSLKPLVDLWEGRWDEAAALATRVLETSRRTGNRWDEWASHHLAARVRYLLGEPEAAAEQLEQALAIVADGGARYFELWVLPDLARACAESGRLEEARAHVERAREIVDAGQDWRGRLGHVELADAVALSLERREGDADAAFARARATFDRFRLRSEEAEALQQWGTALLRAGAVREAAERLDDALALYRRHGAGAVWLERVETARHSALQTRR